MKVFANVQVSQRRNLYGFGGPLTATEWIPMTFDEDAHIPLG